MSSDLPEQLTAEQPEAHPKASALLARVNGEDVVELPKDLYIPPDAMKVFLKAFEGPLDFLLYLIRKQNIDILDIPIASITQQYMGYIEALEELKVELAAEYLVMAAILAEIKSRMLLPRTAEPGQEEEDPRAELVRRLQEYERYKQAAQDLDALPRIERDLFVSQIDTSAITAPKVLAQVSLKELLAALVTVYQRVELNTSHQIHIDALSVREKMTHILDKLHNQEHVLFSDLFRINEGRLGVVVTFLAMLELLKQHVIEFIQAGAFAPIYLKSHQSR